jgi:Tfp pilus assembly protein PilF
LAPARVRRTQILLAVACLALTNAAPRSAIEQGLAAFRERDFGTARKCFEQAVREQPGRALAHKLLGMTYTAEQNDPAAREHYQRACSLDPQEQNACYYLGQTLYRLDRSQQAIDAFEIALKKADGRGRPSLGMALAFEALGKSADAERWYREAIQSGEKRARVDYGLFLLKLGRTQDGLALLRDAGSPEDYQRALKAVENSPHNRVSTEPVPVRFKSSPLDMVVRNGAQGEKHQVEMMIAGTAVFDYDNDDWPDIFVSNGAELPSLRKTEPSYYNRLFRNNRDGTFSDVTVPAGLAGEGYSMGVAAADYNNDGWADLFVTGVRGNKLYRNRGDGSFEDVTGHAGLGGDNGWAVSAGWFDFDNDGWLDLFVVHYVAWDPGREPYCGDLRPGYRTYCHPQNYTGLPNALYRNRGDGTFADVSTASGIAAHRGKGMGLAFGDYDNDGRMDVFVANDTEPNFLFHNEGGGRFRELALGAGVAFNPEGKALSSMGVDFRDYDNDGLEDLSITALTNETFPLYRNIGRGQFADMTILSGSAAGSLPWSGWSLGVVDLNNDGFKDVFTANGNVQDNAELTTSRSSRQANIVFLNRGDGRFQAQSLPGVAFHRGAAFGDFDRDGRMDVVVTRLNESPVVLHNVTPSPGHWIGLRLTGTRSNRDGIGARVKVMTAGGAQWNRVTTAAGYAGSNEPAVHFGLGTESRVSRIDIEWPSGTHQTLENIPADRYLSVEEPRSQYRN